MLFSLLYNSQCATIAENSPWPAPHFSATKRIQSKKHILRDGFSASLALNPRPY